MYKGKKILCMIPARGGSKGVKRKNIKMLCGKPLIAYTIEHAQGSKHIDRIIVDSEDKEILEVAAKFGGKSHYVRPVELAGDTSSIFDAMVYCIHWLKENEKYDFDIFVMLHVTTPLRTSTDIDKCIEKLIDNDADNVFSVAPSYKNPYFNMVEVDERGIARLCKPGKFINRQETPVTYDMNASIYVWKKDVLLATRTSFNGHTLVYEMPRERSVDIDEPIDFALAEALMLKTAV